MSLWHEAFGTGVSYDAGSSPSVEYIDEGITLGKLPSAQDQIDFEYEGKPCSIDLGIRNRVRHLQNDGFTVEFQLCSNRVLRVKVEWNP